MELWSNQSSPDAIQCAFRKGDATFPNSTYYLFLGPETYSGYLKITSDYIIAYSSVSFSVDEWHHIAAVNDGQYLRLFLDGELAGETKSDGLTPARNQSSLVIGGRISFNDSYFQGMMDELRFSSVARYSLSFTPERRFEPDADTIALWRFDEGTGKQTADTTGTLIGDLIGDVEFVECK